MLRFWPPADVQHPGPELRTPGQIKSQIKGKIKSQIKSPVKSQIKRMCKPCEDELEKFKGILLIFCGFSLGRTSPADLSRGPLPRTSPTHISFGPLSGS